MAKTSLRAYDREIGELIEQGRRLDEAIAHCLHILRTYPKHLETYRLLGKAYLEAKRYDQAVDIFQRVLVAVPEDFVAHVGMSIIADDQGKLDEAIWHMERAFEVQPSNAAIQAELQRLFGRRDGVEPPKIRLTRGALAHMYVQGDLFAQAISEIRAVLAHDANRTDMQALLAKAYARNGQKAEAADACSTLLAISPYCLDANRLMAEGLAAAPDSDTVREYRRRVIELDPYAEFAAGSAFSSEGVADNAISLQRLDYTGQAAVPGADVALSLDAAFGASDSTGSPPSWMASGQSAEPTPAATREQLQAAPIPDFMADAGWSATGAGPISETPEAESGIYEEPAASLGDLPEWVRALEPGEGADLRSRSEAETVQTDDWLREPHDAGSRTPLADALGAVTPAEEGTPSWLKDLAVGAEESGEESAEEIGAPPPSALGSFASSGDPFKSAPDSDDGMAWLEGLAEKHGAKPEELITPRGSRPSEPPAWVEEADRLGTTTPAEAASFAMAPDGNEGNPFEAGGAKPPAAAEQALDWMSGLAGPQAFEGMERNQQPEQAPIMDAAPEPPRQNPARSSESRSAEDQRPGGDGRIGERTPISGRDKSSDPGSDVDLPDWLAGLDRADFRTAGPSANETRQPAPPGPEELPDWLRVPDEPAKVVPLPEPRAWRPAEAEVSPAARQPEPEPTMEFNEPESSPLAGAEVLPESPAEASRREPIPSRTRPAPDAMNGLPSLNAAKAEMGRGNIAAALDQYARLIRRGRSLEEIIRDLRDALYRYPVEVPIWQALGDAYMRANRLQEALDAYTKAEELLR